METQPSSPHPGTRIRWRKAKPTNESLRLVGGSGCGSHRWMRRKTPTSRTDSLVVVEPGAGRKNQPTSRYDSLVVVDVAVVGGCEEKHQRVLTTRWRWWWSVEKGKSHQRVLTTRWWWWSQALAEKSHQRVVVTRWWWWSWVLAVGCEENTNESLRLVGGGEGGRRMRSHQRVILTRWWW